MPVINTKVLNIERQQKAGRSTNQTAEKKKRNTQEHGDSESDD